MLGFHCKLLMLSVLVEGFSWEPLPPNFDVRKPDELLPAVKNMKYNWKKIPFDRIFVFGDSTCDTGRLMKLKEAEVKSVGVNYWRGRFCDGPIWVDYLSAMNNVKVDSFCFGASVINSKNFEFTPGIPDFAEQLKIFHKERNQTSYENPLAIISFVGNDMLNVFKGAKEVAKHGEGVIQDIIDQEGIKNIMISLTPVEDFIAKGLNKEFKSASERLMARNPGTEIITISVIDQAISMKRISPPSADQYRWRVEPCTNLATKVTCNDPENHFQEDHAHVTTIPNYHIAAYLSRMIAAYWGN